MAKKLIYTTVEIITPTVIRFDITIPANKTEYFHVLPGGSCHENAGDYTVEVYTYNNTSESVTVEKIKNDEIIGTYTVEPHERKRDAIKRGEYIRLKEFKNYEDAIFIEWPKS